MAILQVIGDSGPIKQSVQTQWSYPGGEAQNEIYKGVYAQIKALYDSYKEVAGFIPAIDNLQLTYERGMGTLTIATIQDGPEQYELVSNMYSFPIEYHEYFTEESPVLTSAFRHAVRVAFEIGINKNPDQGLAAPFDGSAFSAKQQTLYDFLASGVDSYPEAGYVLRRSQIVSRRSQVKASFANVNRVEAPPDVAAVNTLIGALPSTDKWCKQAPQVRMYGNRKWQITQEWWWAKRGWSIILFGGGASP